MQLEADLSAKITVFIGDNGEGKTNILEAIYLIGHRRSFRGGRIADTIRFDCPEASISALITHSGVDHDLRVILKERTRKFTIDGKNTSSSAAQQLHLPIIAFTPADLAIPHGPPSERRHAIDSALSSLSPIYAQTLRHYAKVVRTRNSILKDPQKSTADLLDVYDEQLSKLGAKITITRIRYLGLLSPRVEQLYRRITSSNDAARLEYAGQRSGEENHSAEQLNSEESIARYWHADRIYQRLRRSRPLDIARRTTTTGPHHDDIDFRLRNRSARHYASQGEARAMVLAFKMAQILDTIDRLKKPPLLLLDDVSSELDTKRNKALFSLVEEVSCQTVITSSRPDILPRIEKSNIYSVVNGSIFSQLSFR